MTLTKEQIIETLQHGISVASGFPDSKKAQIDLAIFRIALASLTAEPALTVGHGSDALAYRRLIQSFAPGTKLYTAPPSPVVPDVLAGKSFEYIANKFQVSISEAQWILVGWNACRAAIFQGAAGNSPAIPDDVRRMDWLVSKTVDVREPMVYGSHSLFWSQTITDEEDDYHATKLREQIDAAMAEENAAAPQQEVKP